MAENDETNDVVVPVVSEELHAEAVPVEKGTVRVTKRVEGHDEILEQELRKGRAEVKRVKTDRVVDGPQPVTQSGNTVIIPVVSEVLRVQKQWVVTEEIHITQIEERERVEQKFAVNHEVAEVERFDEAGNVVPAPIMEPASGRRTGLTRRLAKAASQSAGPSRTERRVLSDTKSIVRDKKVT